MSPCTHDSFMMYVIVYYNNILADLQKLNYNLIMIVIFR